KIRISDIDYEYDKDKETFKLKLLFENENISNINDEFINLLNDDDKSIYEVVLKILNKYYNYTGNIKIEKYIPF
ncbi:MAG: hypothetical protein ACOC1O_05325, partial [bacterium]